MPLFYFDVCDGFSGLDRVGKDCPDRDAARREASRRARTLLADQADWFRTGQDWQINIVDATGASVLALSFGSSAGAVGSGEGGRARIPAMDLMPIDAASAGEQAI